MTFLKKKSPSYPISTPLLPDSQFSPFREAHLVYPAPYHRASLGVQGLGYLSLGGNDRTAPLEPASHPCCPPPSPQQLKGLVTGGGGGGGEDHRPQEGGGTRVRSNGWTAERVLQAKGALQQRLGSSIFWELTQHLGILLHMALPKLGPCYLLAATGVTRTLG